jgi:hypothetical protein
MSNSKYGSRKYHLALLALAVIFALAWNGMLDTVAATAIIAAAGIYGHLNLKQKREEAQAKLDAAEATAL